MINAFFLLRRCSLRPVAPCLPLQLQLTLTPLPVTDGCFAVLGPCQVVCRQCGSSRCCVSACRAVLSFPPTRAGYNLGASPSRWSPPSPANTSIYANCLFLLWHAQCLNRSEHSLGHREIRKPPSLVWRQLPLPPRRRRQVHIFGVAIYGCRPPPPRPSHRVRFRTLFR